MSDPLIVVVPHSLGKQEARTRIESGLLQVRRELSAKNALLEESWIDDRMSFRVEVMKVSIDGAVEVGERDVRVELNLPLMLRAVASAIRSRIERQGTTMLEKK